MSISISGRVRRSRSAGPLSLLMMDIPWLLTAIMGLATTKVSCHNDTNSFANPPPIPLEGVRLYQGVRNKTIPNYAMIGARDFSDRDGGSEGLGFVGILDGLNDGLWCQSAMNVSGIGSWKLPNGSAVSDDLEFNPVHMANRPGQVGLLRSGGLGSYPYQGMYTCTIPDEKEVSQTLVVWAAANSVYDGKSPNPFPTPAVTMVSFIPSTKPRDTDPPELILSFNVMVAPPTYVTCQVNSTPVDVAVLSREVTAGEYQTTSNTSPVTNVTVTLRTRLPGDYKCTVLVYRESGNNLTENTSAITVSVTGTPKNVMYVRTGEYTIQISWSAPASNTPPVAGYEVFYAESGSHTTKSGGTTNNVTTNVTIPTLNIMYDLFVVAFSKASNALPSGRSNNITIDISPLITHTPTPSPTQSPTPSPAQPPITDSMMGTAMSDALTFSETKSVTFPSTVTIVETTSVPSSITNPTTTQLPMEGSSIGVIAGVIASVFITLITIIVIIVVILLWRFRSKSKQNLVKKQNDSVQFSKMREEEEEPDVKLATVPVIEKFPGTMTVEMGQQVKLQVSISGVPKPSYQWYHNDQPVEQDYAHELTTEGSLVMATAEEKHRGTYKLVAENSAGVAEKSLVLNVVKDEEDEGNAALIDNDYAVINQLPLEAIPVAEFGQYVASSHADNHKGFRSIYWNLASKEDEHSVTVAVTPTNKPLNRFGNITVYDDNRIILKPIGNLSDCQHDYINASYIDGYTIHHEYIATQGPMAKTLVDFWRLVWQEKPQAILMVTNLKEEDKVKCQQYWPETSSENYGPFTVTLTEQQIFTDYTIRTLQVKLSNSSESSHRVIQYHFTSWPDHGVPEYATSILTLQRQIKQNHKPKQGSILVHCSAGVGRTGTFIAIDMALEKIENEGVVDISNIVIKMRQQRMKMVQTMDQFMFIFDAVLESITCGDTQIPTAKFRSALQQLGSMNPETGKTGFQQQFDVLTQVTPNSAEVRRTIASQYPELNRTLEFAAPDKHRVPLKGCTHDYINATFVNGYKQKKAFIIAQSPMENTCNEFWKMIVQRGCGVIVMLCHAEENGQETCVQYWPSVSDSKVFAEFLIEIQNEVEYPGFVERTLSVTEKANANVHKVIQFQITNWECPGGCSNLQTIVSVQEEVYKVQRRTGNNPVVVHCSDTVSRSGMFCAIATVIDRCKTEAMVDVFQVVKVQRVQKPGLVHDVEQYHLVFDVILAFLDSFETYTNFQ